MATIPAIRKLRGRIAEVGVKRQDIALQMGISESLFSLYINGRRQPPENFEERVLAALDVLFEAQRAAQEAWDRVLAESLDPGGKRSEADGDRHPKEPVGV